MEKPQRFERLVLGVLLFVTLLTFSGLVFTYLKKPATPAPVIRNFIGEQGPQGLSVQGPQGYSGAQGIQGIQGVKGDIGPQGPIGATGSQGSVGMQGPQGDQGPVGATGQDGRQVEFRCATNHNYQWRYVGDEDWQNIQKNSLACYQAGL